MCPTSISIMRISDTKYKDTYTKKKRIADSENMSNYGLSLIWEHNDSLGFPYNDSILYLLYQVFQILADFK
jgi:hypothetical protein